MDDVHSDHPFLGTHIDDCQLVPVSFKRFGCFICVAHPFLGRNICLGLRWYSFSQQVARVFNVEIWRRRFPLKFKRVGNSWWGTSTFVVKALSSLYQFNHVTFQTSITSDWNKLTIYCSLLFATHGNRNGDIAKSTACNTWIHRKCTEWNWTEEMGKSIASFLFTWREQRRRNVYD